jgi:exopolysaccharide biosynthesis protein
MVLSISPAMARLIANVTNGSVVRISTATLPDVRGARMAIGGGPILVKDGRRQKIDGTGLFDANSYSVRSMEERHPRTAVGWNEKFIYLVEVDGRYRTSAGMTLAEVAGYLLGIGCTDAVNLDGGGSATLWCNGRVANRPCDGRERPIANGLVVLRKSAPAGSK